MRTYKTNESGWHHCIEEDFKGQPPKIFGFFHSFEPTLFISDPDLLNDIYITQNKYFDKHPAMKNLFDPLTGDTMFWMESNEQWHQKRKVLSTAFYKDKLLLMSQIIKEQVKKSMIQWKENYVQKGQNINVITELANIFLRIILACAFGEDISDRLVDYTENGQTQKQPLSYALRNNLERLLYRLFTPQLVFLPESHKLYLSKADRDDRENSRRIRALAIEVVEQRRKEIKNPDYQDRGDLLHILLHDDLFKNNNEIIVDECLVFFLAGSQTTSIQIANTLMYLTQQPELLKKVKTEINNVMITPFLQEQKLEKLSFGQICDIANFDNTQELRYLSQCLNEALRLDPPVHYSTTMTFNQDVHIGPYILKKGDQFQIDNRHNQRNPEEYQEPTKYIPERFDPNSPYYLTPKGKKRHPMSFMPFLGGKRICLGKTFSEVSAKIVASAIFTLFDFEFVNPEHKTEKPSNNLSLMKEPEVFMKIKVVE